jgi:hypothetical protein
VCDLYLPRWYRIEFIAVKKNSDTMSTLPLRVISVLVSVADMMLLLFVLVGFQVHTHTNGKELTRGRARYIFESVVAMNLMFIYLL